MTYHFSKKLNMSMNEAIARVTDILKEEGFGILTDIDIQKTLKAKLTEKLQSKLDAHKIEKHGKKDKDES